MNKSKDIAEKLKGYQRTGSHLKAKEYLYGWFPPVADIYQRCVEKYPSYELQCLYQHSNSRFVDRDLGVKTPEVPDHLKSESIQQDIPKSQLHSAEPHSYNEEKSQQLIENVNSLIEKLEPEDLPVNSQTSNVDEEIPLNRSLANRPKTAVCPTKDTESNHTESKRKSKRPKSVPATKISSFESEDMSYRNSKKFTSSSATDYIKQLKIPNAYGYPHKTWESDEYETVVEIVISPPTSPRTIQQSTDKVKEYLTSKMSGDYDQNVTNLQSDSTKQDESRAVKQAKLSSTTGSPSKKDRNIPTAVTVSHNDGKHSIASNVEKVTANKAVVHKKMGSDAGSKQVLPVKVLQVSEGMINDRKKTISKESSKGKEAGVNIAQNTNKITTLNNGHSHPVHNVMPASTQRQQQHRGSLKSRSFSHFSLANNSSSGPRKLTGSISTSPHSMMRRSNPPLRSNLKSQSMLSFRSPSMSNSLSLPTYSTGNSSPAKKSTTATVRSLFLASPSRESVVVEDIRNKHPRSKEMSFHGNNKHPNNNELASQYTAYQAFYNHKIRNLQWKMYKNKY